MRFKEIRIGELIEFTDSTLYKKNQHIPISKNRAISQYHNPRADKDDIALLLALDDTDAIVGYIGALPERFAKYPTLKLAWNTGWWVDPKKGKQAAMPLFFKLMYLWNNKLIFSDMPLHTQDIIFQLNQFTAQKKLKGYKYFIKLNLAHILPKRNKLFLWAKPFLFATDTISNTAIHAAHQLKLKLMNKAIFGEVTYIDRIDKEAEEFINNVNKMELFRRETSEINWILEYPWLEEGTENNESKRYFFSLKTPIFKNFIVKVYDKSGNLTAVLFLNINNRTVKLPYVFAKKEDYSVVVSFLYHFLLQEKVCSFITYNATLVKAINEQRGRPFWLKKTIQRAFVVSNALVDYTDWNFDFQEGNSDVVFT